METTSDTTAANKRKRESVRASSQHSLSQPTRPKKSKNQQVPMSSVTDHNNVYREAPYLKVSPRLLLHALRRTPDDVFQTKSEQDFVYTRLKLFDQHYSLDLHRSLWQSYLDLGSEQQLWTVSRDLPRFDCDSHSFCA